MPIGLIAVCCRNDGTVRLTKSLFRLLTAIRLLSGGVARDLRRLRHAFEAHLVSDAAVSGADQKQRRLFVIDRDQHAPSAEIARPASGRGVLIFPRKLPSRQIDHRHRAVFLILRLLPAVW